MKFIRLYAEVLGDSAEEYRKFLKRLNKNLLNVAEVGRPTFNRHSRVFYTIIKEECLNEVISKVEKCLTHKMSVQILPIEEKYYCEHSMITFNRG